MVNTANSVKEKADCYIGDPSRTIKVTLWENFTTSVQVEKPYTFSNVRVLKEFKLHLIVQVDVGHIPLQLHHVSRTGSQIS